MIIWTIVNLRTFYYLKIVLKSRDMDQRRDYDRSRITFFEELLQGFDQPKDSLILKSNKKDKPQKKLYILTVEPKVTKKKSGIYFSSSDDEKSLERIPRKKEVSRVSFLDDSDNSETDMNTTPKEMEIDENLVEEFIKRWIIVTLNTLRPERLLNPILEERGETMTIFVNDPDGRNISLQILPYDHIWPKI